MILKAKTALINGMSNSIGEKATQLTKLLEAGFPVPKGFIVPPATADAFFAFGRLKDKILMLASRCDFGNPADISRVSAAVKKLVLSAEMPAEISEALLDACLKLPKGKVMLTPSPEPGAVDAPSPIYGLSGEASILLGIRELWAGCFGPESLYAVSTSDFPSLPICVQSQPEILASGLLATIAQDKSACVVKAVWGGGGLTGNLFGADLYVMGRETAEEKDKVRSLQTKQVVFRHGQIEEAALPPDKQRKQKLNQGALTQLAEIARGLTRLMYFPQEAVFLYDGKTVYLNGVRAAQSALEIPGEAPQAAKVDRRILLKGVGITPGITTGIVRVVRSPEEHQLTAGNILVAAKLAHLSPDLIRGAKGIVLEESLPEGTIPKIADRGITVLTSALGAVDYLETGSYVTLHSPRGEVLAGGYSAPTTVPKPRSNTAIHIGSGIMLGTSHEFEPVDTRSHLLLSPEKLAAELGAKPKQLTASLTRAIQGAAAHYTKNPLIYAFHPPRAFGLIQPQAEIAALQNVHSQSYGRRISLLIPPVRTAFEAVLWVRALGEKLPRSAQMRYFLDLSIPSMLWQIDRVAGMVDGIVLDLDMLAEHLFASDPESGDFHFAGDDLSPTLLAILKMAWDTCQAEGIYLILKGKLPTHDSYLQFAVRAGIAEVSLPQDLIVSAKERLLVLEQERATNV